MDQVNPNRHQKSGYAKICGILSLIFAIPSVLIPVVGPVFITPLAIVFGIFALYGGSKGIGIATLIIIVVNLIISPSFWANLYIGATESGTIVNQIISYIDLIGLVLMFVFVIYPKRKL